MQKAEFFAQDLKTREIAPALISYHSSLLELLSSQKYFLRSTRYAENFYNVESYDRSGTVNKFIIFSTQFVQCTPRPPKRRKMGGRRFDVLEF